MFKLWVVLIIGLLLIMGLIYLFRAEPDNESFSCVIKPQVVASKTLDKRLMVATGYAIGPPYNSITRSGHPVVSKGFLKIGSIDVFTVAVDKSVIPLNSVLWIDGLGIGIASDTGDLIRGNRIDICFVTMGEAARWGRRKVNVMILSTGEDR